MPGWNLTCWRQWARHCATWRGELTSDWLSLSSTSPKLSPALWPRAPTNMKHRDKLKDHILKIKLGSLLKTRNWSTLVFFHCELYRCRIQFITDNETHSRMKWKQFDRFGIRVPEQKGIFFGSVSSEFRPDRGLLSNWSLESWETGLLTKPSFRSRFVGLYKIRQTLPGKVTHALTLLVTHSSAHNQHERETSGC